MNPLARLLAARGHQVQGSDRSLDRGENQTIRDLLVAAGITLLPQDGSAIQPSLDRFVYSAAVEPDTPEYQAARRLGIPTQARPALLAEVVAAGRPGVAVAGTSGKSTVVGMAAWILRSLGRPATVLGGAALAEAGASHMGCFAAAGDADPVLAEACESDGTLVGYQPGLGLVHNLTRDHDELPGLRQQFLRFAGQSRQLLVNAACPEALALGSGHPQVQTYGLAPTAGFRLEILEPGPERSQGELSVPGTAVPVLVDLPQPGAHNLENAAAALAITTLLGCEVSAAAAALASFPGVARRFQVLGVTDSGIRVVDDYAHNGAKLAAAIRAAQLGCERLIAVFQPHGYGPARFLRAELRALLPEVLRPQDQFCYAEIYYAGGTVQADLSSRDLAADLAASRPCGYAADHLEILDWVADQAAPGDTVLLMGARDPRLGDLAQAVYSLL